MPLSLPVDPLENFMCGSTTLRWLKSISTWVFFTILMASSTSSTSHSLTTYMISTFPYLYLMRSLSHFYRHFYPCSTSCGFSKNHRYKTDIVSLLTLPKLQHLGLPSDLMKSRVLDESLSVFNQSSVWRIFYCILTKSHISCIYIYLCHHIFCH